jgi:Rps23 Pro-64 3,4-dihydroxylase Tpa1-like proline 4-hydroxylase
MLADLDAPPGPFADGLGTAQVHASLASRHGEYETARPFPHAVVDDLFDQALLRRVAAEFPPPESMSIRFDDPLQRKSAEPLWERFGSATRDLLGVLQSGGFLDALEALTGIPGLISDPYLVGGGQHQIGAGGCLKVHADFNRHPRYDLDRRLNVLLYLNEGWQRAWGGQLELWNTAMTAAEVRVEPVMGRMVVFSTTSTSYHGHPEPLHTPPGVMRKSLALYYYTSAATDVRVPAHSTLFQARPGESGERSATRALRIRRRLVAATPPAVLEALRRVRSGRD